MGECAAFGQSLFSLSSWNKKGERAREYVWGDAVLPFTVARLSAGRATKRTSSRNVLARIGPETPEHLGWLLHAFLSCEHPVPIAIEKPHLRFRQAGRQAK